MRDVKRYRVQAAHQGRHGTDKPYVCIETDDVDIALEELDELLDKEPDDVLITFICRPKKEKDG